MNDFDLVRGVATEVLEAELKRRRDIKPSALPLYSVNYPFVDYSELYNYTISLVDSLDMEEGLSDDFEQSLMEKAIEAVYGKDIWEWWRRKQ